MHILRSLAPAVARVSLREALRANEEAADMIHIWLEGDVYPQPRPALHNEGVAA